ncbi:hypothetical protein [Marinobacter metalliresistant]|uniref:Uncharacterized protein n=1 Tax=Marinobacter metalliresistant TaxID=2961995 RepID=A0ABZ2VZM9_9GAMM
MTDSDAMSAAVIRPLPKLGPLIKHNILTAISESAVETISAQKLMGWQECVVLLLPRLSLCQTVDCDLKGAMPCRQCNVTS